MSALAIHPALIRLLRFQAVAKVRKFRRNFASRRRLVLSLLALVLAVVWLGNAVASVLLREPYAPEAFRRGISLALMLYCSWHVIRVAYQRPGEAIEWTPAECEFLCGGPFTRRELLTYRLLVILSATWPKALLVAFLLTPDLPLWWSGFLGLLLGLVLLEYFRLIVETIACGVPRHVYTAARGIVFGGLFLLVICGLHSAVGTTETRELAGLDDGRQFLAAWVSGMTTLRESSIGRIVETPFALFADVITARNVSWSLGRNLLLAAALVGTTAWIAARLDGSFFESRWNSDSIPERGDGSSAADSASGSAEHRLPLIPALAGIGPVAWRQWKAAWTHTGSLAVALIVPGVMACLPLTVPAGGEVTLFRVVASAAFYSVVLLPAALKFDFRRDFDRLPTLKMLPRHPTAVVLGQLATPIALTLAYQATVIAAAVSLRPAPGHLVVWSALLLVPMTVLFVAMDNLIFLLYPHRLNQEGFEVFLRTTLTFTAKGLLLATASILVLLWIPVSRLIAQAAGISEASRFIFGGGVSAMTAAAAAFAVFLLVRTFANFDPSLDQGG